MLDLIGKAGSSLLLLLVAAAVLPVSLAASPHHGSASLCQIGLNDFQVPDQCFLPSRIALVESKMSVRPVRPVAPVTRIVHLRLTQLRLRNPGNPLEIDYLFGRVPLNARRFADIMSHASRYVIVGEVVGLSSISRPSLFRHKSADGGTAYVEWYANFRCHNLLLFITSNLNGRPIRALGRAILNAEVCGK